VSVIAASTAKAAWRKSSCGSRRDHAVRIEAPIGGVHAPAATAATMAAGQRRKFSRKGRHSSAVPLTVPVNGSTRRAPTRSTSLPRTGEVHPAAIPCAAVSVPARANDPVTR
jgi:hypothetical protein